LEPGDAAPPERPILPERRSQAAHEDFSADFPWHLPIGQPRARRVDAAASASKEIAMAFSSILFLFGFLPLALGVY